MHGTKCDRPKLFMLFAALSLIGLLCTLFMAQEEIRTIVHYLAPLENTKAYVQKYKARQHFTESNRSYILMWRPPWGIADQAVPEGTRIGNCTLTFDRSMLPRAGAVIFHYTDNSIPIPWRLHRDIGQYFVFYSIESPSFMLNVERKTFQNLDNFFNFTMNYKESSEVFYPYLTSRDAKEIFGRGKEFVDTIMKREKKLALWVVSNCKALRGSKIRMKYSNEMVAAGMQIDRYGNCFGNRREYDRLQQENLPFYKFYLSFENAEHCKDYITEKFWARGILDGRVPVVWGPSKADVTRLAPPGSFIHADDFKSPAELAKYLMVLDKNDTAYREYFAWVEKPSGAWKERLLKLYSKTREELLCDIVMEHKINKVIPSIYDDLYKDEAKSCLAA